MLRVLMAATSYPRSDEDWQGIFIRRMADALAGQEALELRVWAPPGPLHPRAGSALSDADSVFLARLQHEGGIAQQLRARPLRGLVAGLELTARLHGACRRSAGWAAVLHLNWLQCVLAAAGLRQPVLATVLGSDLALLEKPAVRIAIRAALRNRRAILCPNAEWMVPTLRERLGAATQIRYVPFGLDERWFDVARQPRSDRRVWLTVLRITRRKIGALFEWTRELDRSRHEFHLFGPLQEPVEIPGWIVHHGPVTPDELARHWYPLASGMVSLSEHDEGRPQVLLEAMAAGLPVVCSRTPAHTDLLGRSQAGLLVATRDEFLAALAELGDSERSLQMTRRAREHMRGAYGSWGDCARRYMAVYEALLDEPRTCAS